MNQEEFLKMASEIDNNAIDDDKKESVSPEENQNENIENSEAENADVNKENENDGLNDLSDTEKEAYELGWRPENEYKGKGSWKDAETFLTISKLNKTVAELKDQTKKREREFDRRLEQQHEYYKLQVEREKKALEEKFKSSVEDGDVEAADKYRLEIEELKQKSDQFKEKTTSEIEISPEVDNWIARNPWLNTDAQKAQVAQSLLADIEAKNPHSSIQQNLDRLDDSLAKLYNTQPIVNSKRMAPTSNESRNVVNRQRKSYREATSLKDLTDDEKEAWRVLGNAIYNGNQKDFLKNVNKNRELEQKEGRR